MVKAILHLVLLFHFSQCLAGDTTSTSCTYFGVEMNVPEGCESGESKIACGKDFVDWFLFEEIPVEFKMQASQMMMDKVVDYIDEKDPKNKKKRMTFKSLDDEIDGWLIHCDFNKEKKCFIVASGKVKGEPVTIYCGIMGKVNKRIGLPSFVEQIIQLE